MRSNAIIAILLTVSVLLIACGPEQPAPAAQPAAASLPPPPVVEQPEGQVTTVQIVRYDFYPKTVSIKVGDSVKWANNDGTSHSIKLLGAPPSPILSPGQTYEMPFTDKGTFQYSCGIHAKMQGMVIVE